MINKIISGTDLRRTLLMCLFFFSEKPYLFFKIIPKIWCSSSISLNYINKKLHNYQSNISFLNNSCCAQSITTS